MQKIGECLSQARRNLLSILSLSIHLILLVSAIVVIWSGLIRSCFQETRLQTISSYILVVDDGKRHNPATVFSVIFHCVNKCFFLSPFPTIFPPNLIVPITSSKELSSLYRKSCEKHNTAPISSIVEHLEAINLESPTTTRTEVLNLRYETLSHESCEALEELFKRVKYKAIDLTSCSLDDVSATAIFDMIEYYEACNDLNISENINIKNRGWQSCKYSLSTLLKGLLLIATFLINFQASI